MINDIKQVSPSSLLVKFADDITVSIPVRAGDSNIAESEVSSIMEWAEKNQMTLNLNKTWEMLLKSGSLKVPPDPLAHRLLGVTFENDPVNWDSHIDHVLSKASSRLYILRVCRFYGYPKEQLDLLFQSLIISVFTYAIEVWGCCYYDTVNILRELTNCLLRLLSGSLSKSGPLDFGTKNNFPSFFVSEKDLAHIYKKAIY